MIFDQAFFDEHQGTLLGYLNSPVGAVVRRSLWVPDRRPLIKVTPESYHVLLPDGRVRAILHATNQHAQALQKNYRYMWEVLHWWDLRIANRLLPAWNVGFDSYSSQPDGTAGVDTYLHSGSPTTNNGTDTSLRIGEHSAATAVFRTLIKFNFSSVTPPVVTSSIVFSMWLYANEASVSGTFPLYRQKRDWVEDQATWNIWKTSNNWATAGGFDASDCEQTAVATGITLAAAEGAGEKQWTGWTTTSLDAMINGTFTNNGFMGKATTEVDNGHVFRSSDYTTAGERPKLAFTYVPAISIPVIMHQLRQQGIS